MSCPPLIPQDGDIKIDINLEILPNDIIVIPGHEPASYSSSKTLSENLAKSNTRFYVSLKEALTISGSYVKFSGSNFNGKPIRWYVIPWKSSACDQGIDHYAQLYKLAKTEEVEYIDHSSCGFNFNLSPDLVDQQYQTLSDPYLQEGSTTIPGSTILPNIPEWAGVVSQ